MKITVNGKTHEVAECVLNYTRIVELANTQWGKEALHSVTYQHRVPFDKLPGERDGMLSPGQSVSVSEGMIINAVVTGSA